MNYRMDLFWHRAANLYKMYQGAEDPDFKRIWMDKLQLLMQGISGVDKKELNWYNRDMFKLIVIILLILILMNTCGG